MDIMPVSRVAKGFVSLMQAEDKASNGKALAIIPHVADFYWPQHDMAIMTYMGLGAALFQKVMPNAPIFETKHQVIWLLLTFFLFHILLNMLRCFLF